MILCLLQAICAFLYVITSYHLTGNYINQTRFYYFALFVVMGSLCAQSWGFFVGSTLRVKVSIHAASIGK